MKRLIAFFASISLLMGQGALAQSQIGDYPAAPSVNLGDYTLTQQGPKGTPYTKMRVQDILGTISKMPSITLPQTTITGPAVQMPQAASRPLTPTTGQLFFNVTTNQFEYWTGTAWLALTATSVSSTQQVIPAPATALVAGTVSTTQVPFSWTAPVTGTTPFTYTIQDKRHADTVWQNFGMTSGTSVTVSGLTSNILYDFQVVTSNATTSTSTSATLTVSTLAIPPVAATGLTAGTATSAVMPLSWTASASGDLPINYQLQETLHSGSTWTNCGTASSAVTGACTGLTAATSYDFRVIASNPSTTTATSGVVTASTATAASVAPNAPTSPTSASITANGFTFSWTAPSTGTTPFAYQPIFKIHTGSTYANYGSSITAASVAVTGLNPATAYDFEVTATNSAGSATSANLAVTTASASSPAAGTCAGSTNSGATDPIITGPSSCSTPVSTSLTITGLGFSDATAASNPGSYAVNLTVASGTATATGAGGTIIGSGSTIAGSGPIASIVALANGGLVYSAPASALTDTITLNIWDPFGNNNTIAWPITVTSVSPGGGTGSGNSGDATGTAAARAGSFLAGFGVNMHTTCCDPGFSAVQAQNNINFLGAKDLGGQGIGVIRDSAITNTTTQTLWPQITAATGVKWDCYMAQDDETVADLNIMKAMGAGVCAFLEGTNEADSAYGDGNRAGELAAMARAAAFQPTVRTAAGVLGVPAINMSSGQGWSFNGTSGDYGVFGDNSASVDYANAHTYCSHSNTGGAGTPNSGGAFGTGCIDQVNRAAKLSAPSKTVAMTEFGAYDWVNEYESAAQILNFIFDASNWGNPYYFVYSMYFDGGNTTPVMFNNVSGTFAPTKAATAIRNMYGLMSDTNTNAKTFATGKLNYSFTGTQAGSNAFTGSQSALFQQSAGTFWLVLWDEMPLTAGAANATHNTTVTFNSATMTSMKCYDPIASMTATVFSATSVTSAVVPVADHPILCSVVHP